MSRPRKDSEQPDMRPVLFDAFWELLESKRLEQVSICQIAAKAGCNRATFYYHFADMDDMLYHALERELVDDPAITSMLSGLIAGKPDCDFLQILEDEHFNRVRLLFVNGGLERVTALLRKLVLDTWTRMLHPGSQLKPETSLIIDYAVSGMVGIITNCLSTTPGNGELTVKLAFLSVFLRDNSAHIIHQVSRTEGIDEQRIIEALSGTGTV